MKDIVRNLAVTQATDKVGGKLTCAWHDAHADLPEKMPEVKRPPLPDGRTTPTGQGHGQKWDVRRKHEAETMYVANSEPAIWR